jgi:hypothetical protein
MATPIIIRMARLEHLTALGYRPHRRTNDYPQRLTADLTALGYRPHRRTNHIRRCLPTSPPITGHAYPI